MQKFIMGLVAALLIGWFGTANAQVLWGGAKYGMKVSEVQRAVVGALPVSNGGTLSGGVVELLRKTGIVTVNKDFNAGFFFKNGKLEQVTLTPANDLSPSEGRSTFDSLVVALRAKYGPEISKKESGGSMKTRDYTWMSKKTNVSAFFLQVGDNEPVLTVNYQVRLSKEGDNL